jgi:hypothetical protein
VTSQGDASLRGPQARALGPTGAGVTVGVMSDSMNSAPPGIAGSQSTGDLPAGVTDLGDGPPGTDEGRAMAEIVYDEAPGITNMLFDTGTGGAAIKATDIANLVSHGARVIADDTFYLTEPLFQDGAIAQAVDAAKAAGTAFITSAGNRSEQSWDGTFTPGAGGLNDFGGGDTRQAVVDVPGGGGVANIVLQWDEPWGAATDNFDVNVFGNNSAAFTCSSSTAFPIETCNIINNTAGPIEIEIEIHHISGTDNPRMKYVVANNFGPFTIKEHATNGGAIDPDAASANGSLSVAAVCWSTLVGNCFGAAGPQTPEVFSSRGPVVHTLDAAGNRLPSPEVRQKPNVAGTDGVATDLPSGPLNPFFGTSAAAPSVAGIAALALSANPAMTVDQLYALLTNPANALDCTSAAGNPDNDCGSGFLQADRVVTQAKTPPAVSSALSGAPNGANGWFRSPVTVSWNIADANPSVVNTSGCGPTTVANDTAGTTLTCSAAGVGGTGSNSVTVKLDTSRPSKPKFHGITAKVFSRKHVPKRSKVRCTSSDRTSGVQSCKIRGYGKSKGPHKLTATATNGAGETSKRTLTYGVSPVCRVPRLKGKSLSSAETALKDAGCRLGGTTPKHPSSGDKVKSSTPKRGSILRIRSKVRLKLG